MIGTPRLSDKAEERPSAHVVTGPKFVYLCKTDEMLLGAVVEVTTKGFRFDLSNAQWLTTERGGPDGDHCVEVAFVGQAIAVRDSQDPDGPALIFTAAEWDAFLGGAKDGEFDV